MRLFWSSRSPFARKAVVAAHETGLFREIELVRVAVGASILSPEVMRFNPLNKIPTLVLPNGAAVFDSFAIAEYLNANSVLNTIVPTTADEKIRTLRYQNFGDGIMDNALFTQTERTRAQPERSEKRIVAFRSKLSAVLDRLENETSILAGRPFDIGAISIASALAYLDFRPLLFEEWRRTRPRLTDWFFAIESRPSMTETKYEDIW